MATFAALRDGLDDFLTSHLEGLENEQRIEALGWYCHGLGFEVEAKTALGLAGALNPYRPAPARTRPVGAAERSRRDLGARPRGRHLDRGRRPLEPARGHRMRDGFTGRLPAAGDALGTMLGGYRDGRPVREIRRLSPL
ncbi:MAG: hypothetical protein JRH11_23030 [Deltaproteobacteria bacterium]|nr:hypothetical protein [Deltaproteobacteria bacterium]